MRERDFLVEHAPNGWQIHVCPAGPSDPREFPIGNGGTSEQARPVFTKNRWIAVDDGSVPQVQVNSNVYDLQRGRTGDQYKLFFAPGETLTGDPLQVPCAIQTLGRTGVVGKDGSNCSGNVDLCDPNRLPHSNWNLTDGYRPPGGARDCRWSPTASPTEDAIFTIREWWNPQWSDGTLASHCHLMFSWEWSSASAGVVILERLDGAAWKELTRWPFNADPTDEYRDNCHVRSELFETNNMLPASTHQFRFRVPAGSAQPDFKLLDPVVYCRFGAVP